MIPAITDTKKRFTLFFIVFSFLYSVVKVLLIKNYIGLSLVMITASLSFCFNMEEIIFFLLDNILKAEQCSVFFEYPTFLTAIIAVNVCLNKIFLIIWKITQS